jgi:hypothetical protein
MSWKIFILCLLMTSCGAGNELRSDRLIAANWITDAMETLVIQGQSSLIAEAYINGKLVNLKLSAMAQNNSYLVLCLSSLKEVIRRNKQVKLELLVTEEYGKKNFFVGLWDQYSMESFTNKLPMVASGQNWLEVHLDAHWLAELIDSELTPVLLLENDGSPGQWIAIQGEGFQVLERISGSFHPALFNDYQNRPLVSRYDDMLSELPRDQQVWLCTFCDQRWPHDDELIAIELTHALEARRALRLELGK